MDAGRPMNHEYAHNIWLTSCKFLGFEATKLSIHGAAGVFHHATLEVYRIDSEGMATALTRQSYIE
jgi:hypothetical protein